MEIIGDSDSLKCKFMDDTFKEGALRWYMSLPRFSIVSYQDSTKMMVQDFSANKHRKVSTTSLFNVRQGHSESLREYLARFNEETIKVSHLNQEMFVWAFQHGLKVWQFNESSVQKSTSSMNDVITIEEFYIEWEESNMEKRYRDAKEKIRAKKEGVGHNKEYFRTKLWDYITMRPSQRPIDKVAEYTPLNSRREDILREVYNLKLLPISGRLKGVHIVMGNDESAWCAYHKLHGHHTENFHQLNKEIKILIRRGRLMSYVKDVEGQTGKRRHPREDTNSENPTQKKGKNIEEVREAQMTRHTLNTIAGGFTGGGETSSSRKRYAWTMMHVWQKPSSEEEETPNIISFSIRDAEGVLVHENDSMVIKVKIRDWSVKQVLVDSGSSVDVWYWDAFKGMGFDISEMLPFKGTLVRFSGEHVHVLGHFPMITTFGSYDIAKSVKLRYLMVNDASP
ncbi:uncharacterized protein LOC127102173 [Lathyrus oleraceus]|uniref:uncharacterized protein LOC127102173 n=1 Tax=Pisum sativum TaxID=3888 RepID=UPI0021D37A7F|nr:uncharacterized protein LOC127102173 [Pisum sativum]